MIMGQSVLKLSASQEVASHIQMVLDIGTCGQTKNKYTQNLLADVSEDSTRKYSAALLTHDYRTVQGQEKQTSAVQFQPHPLPRIHDGNDKSHYSSLDVRGVPMCAAVGRKS